METRPYFMTNDEWFYFDSDEWLYKLTDKAPKEAIESYKEFYDDTEILNGVELHVDR